MGHPFNTYIFHTSSLICTPLYAFCTPSVLLRVHMRTGNHFEYPSTIIGFFPVYYKSYIKLNYKTVLKYKFSFLLSLRNESYAIINFLRVPIKLNLYCFQPSKPANMFLISGTHVIYLIALRSMMVY